MARSRTVTPARLLVVGYCRVSSHVQAVEGISLDAQRAKIEAWCALHDAELIGIEVDAGISGKRLDTRPGVQLALDAIRTGRATTLVVCDLSRLSRSTRELLMVVDRYFRSGERSLVSIKESIDTTTPSGRMVVTVLAALGELEREQTGERTRIALAHMAAEGRYVGGHAPYGYQLGTDGETVIEVAAEQATIARARTLKLAGLSLRAVAATLASEGRVSRVGKPFAATTIAAMISA